MERLFSIVTGEGDFNETLRSRGLRELWNSKFPPEDRVQSGTDQKLEWEHNGWKASAVRYFRTPQGQLPVTLHAITLTMIGGPDLTAWHSTALKQLSASAGGGASEFNQTVKRLTGAD